MRLLDVSPRVAALRRGGSQARILGILRSLAERHEVRMFSQARLSELGFARGGGPAGPPPELVHASRAAALIAEVGERTWMTAPVLSGLALAATLSSVS